MPSPRRRNSSTLVEPWYSLDGLDGLPLTDCLSPIEDNIPWSTLDYELHAELVAHYLQIELEEKECYPQLLGHGEGYWGGWVGDRTAREVPNFSVLGYWSGG